MIEYTREEILERLKKFELGQEDPRAAYREFWTQVIRELDKDHKPEE